MELKTERLLLRPWRDEDAEDLYKYVKDPDVGPVAGWPVHTSVENSLEILRTVLSAPETYAVALKDTDQAIGSIGLFSPATAHTDVSDDDFEIGYWVGKPFWGRGYIPEACRALMARAFNDLGCNMMWSGYYDGNLKSWRVMEKCGFKYHHTEENCPVELLNEVRTQHFTCVSKAEWEALYL